MARSPMKHVVAHWHKSLSSFQTSSQKFYEAVELALDRRALPGLTVSRVRWSEGGVLAPDREYLHVQVDVYTYDICAAPIGSGYFFSSWVTRKPPQLVFLALLVVLAAAGVLIAAVVFFTTGLSPVSPEALFLFATRHPLLALVVPPVSLLLSLWGVALVSRIGERDMEDAVLEIPVLGAIYARLFAPPSFYRTDTLLMFQSAVHGAVLEAVDGVTGQHGLRALSDEERKPVFVDAILQGEGEPALR